MKFLRVVRGYTKLNKIKNEDIRKKLEIFAIKDKKMKYKRKWQLHGADSMNESQLPKLALGYKPQGNIDVERPKT